MKQRLFQQIDRFLAQRKRANASGQVDVTGSDMIALEAIVKGLIAAKFDTGGGEAPIECRLNDRTQFESLRFYPLPYLQSDNLPARARIVAINATIMDGQVQHILRETAHAPASLMAAPLPPPARPVKKRATRRKA